MSSYTHKKSIRKITDEQFSEGTTIDGTRIEKAFQDTVDRVETVEKGDISTRFTQQQYVFGYQPIGFSGTGYGSGGGDTAAVGWAEATATVHVDVIGGSVPDTLSRYFTRFPWMVVKNDQYTTLDPQPNAPSTISSFISQMPTRMAEGDEYKAEDYDNKFQHKGFDLSRSKNIASGRIKNKEEWFANQESTGTSSCINWWRAGYVNFKKALADGADTTGAVIPSCHHQMAWTHSWYFRNPVILDDLMVFFRTDVSAYAATFQNAADSNRYADQASIQIIVDSPLVPTFAPNNKQHSSVVYARHLIDFETCKFNPRTVLENANGAVPGDSMEHAFATTGAEDMEPRIYASTGDATDSILNGFMIRDKQLNIPIPANSRVFLAVIVPQWGLTEPSDSDHANVLPWPWGSTGAEDQYGWSVNRAESTFDWSLNGCLTVLEELVD